jgi:uncharacterized repeat protein (TIGR01451 family)
VIRSPPGQGLKYTVIAVNGGSTAADGVHVSITLPTSGTTFVSAAGSNGFDCAGPTAGVLDCSGDLPAGDSTVITVSLTVTDGAPLPDDLHLSATIDPADAFSENDEGNNTQTEDDDDLRHVVHAVCGSRVGAARAVSRSISSGGSVTLTYQVVNVGDMDTTTQIHRRPAPVVTERQDRRRLHRHLLAGGGELEQSECDVHRSSTSSVVQHQQCKGPLAAGEGVTITLTMENDTWLEHLRRRQGRSER